MVSRFANRIHRVAGRFVQGTPIWDIGQNDDGDAAQSEWDICCVLDGCRVDTFCDEFHNVGGEADTDADRVADAYWSVASSSKRWIRRTFASAPTDERIAYVTGNPFSADLVVEESGPGFRADGLAYLHQEPVSYVDDYGIETVSPAQLTDHAIAVWNEEPIDRLIIHYMQPHVPFRSRPEWFDDYLGTETWGAEAWGILRTGRISREAWFDAYRDNLAWVRADGIERLRDSVDATLLLTADHGNAAGQWGVYGHPSGVAVPSVRRVPKQIVDASGNKEKRTPGVEPHRWDESEQTEQLEALGYR